MIIFLIFSIFSQILVCQLNRRHSVDNFWIRKEINFVNLVFVGIFLLCLIPYLFIFDSCTRVLITSFGISLSQGISSIGVIYAVNKLKMKSNTNNNTTINNKGNPDKNVTQKNKEQYEYNCKYCTCIKMTNNNCMCTSMCKFVMNKLPLNVNTAIKAISTSGNVNNSNAKNRNTRGIIIERTSTNTNTTIIVPPKAGNLRRDSQLRYVISFSFFARRV